MLACTVTGVGWSQVFVVSPLLETQGQTVGLRISSSPSPRPRLPPPPPSSSLSLSLSLSRRRSHIYARQDNYYLLLQLLPTCCRRRRRAAGPTRLPAPAPPDRLDPRPSRRRSYFSAQINFAGAGGGGFHLVSPVMLHHHSS